MEIKNSLQTVPTPSLPIAPKTYEARYHDQNNNVLRLFFQRAYGAVSTLLGVAGGQHLNTVYGAFQDDTSQYDGSTTIPYAIRLNTTDYSQGISVVNREVVSTSSITTTTLTCTAITSGRFYPGMLLSGTGVTAGTYIYLQLSSTAAAVATPTATGTSGTPTLVVSDALGIEERQFVSGTGVPANTRVIAVSGTTITLSANLTAPASGTYTFRPWGYQGTYSVSPSQTVSSTTVSGVSASKITVAQPGLYNVQFSFQFANTDTSSEHDVDIWFKKNDVTIPKSNSQFTIPKKHTGVNGHLVAAMNYYVDLDADDYVEIVWHTNDSAVFIEAIPAQTVPIRPSTPSTIVTVSFVSTLATA